MLYYIILIKSINLAAIVAISQAVITKKYYFYPNLKLLTPSKRLVLPAAKENL